MMCEFFMGHFTDITPCVARLEEAHPAAAETPEYLGTATRAAAPPR
jgi:hypothetical protein